MYLCHDQDETSFHPEFHHRCSLTSTPKFVVQSTVPLANKGALAGIGVSRKLNRYTQ